MSEVTVEIPEPEPAPIAPVIVPVTVVTNAPETPAEPAVIDCGHDAIIAELSSRIAELETVPEPEPIVIAEPEPEPESEPDVEPEREHFWYKSLT